VAENPQFLQSVLNLAKYHREHEKFYAQAPLESAVKLQKASRILKTLADRWTHVEPLEPPRGNPFMGCEDLNEPAIIQETGVLFMEGEAEPSEIKQLKRDLGAVADDSSQTGEWLAHAMQSSWDVGKSLLQNPALASVLGERHRIIANDWLAASMSSLVAHLIRRAIDMVNVLDLSPSSIRGDLAGPRSYPDYLYSASELLDRAADILSESATLVHDNERRWRVFRQRVKDLTGGASGQSPEVQA
jgi:hypothetical protein